LKWVGLTPRMRKTRGRKLPVLSLWVQRSLWEEGGKTIQDWSVLGLLNFLEFLQSVLQGVLVAVIVIELLEIGVVAANDLSAAIPAEVYTRFDPRRRVAGEGGKLWGRYGTVVLLGVNVWDDLNGGPFWGELVERSTVCHARANMLSEPKYGHVREKLGERFKMWLCLGGYV
jgi:hypothetical protein